MELGKFGIWTSYRAIGEDSAREAAELVEELGYGAFWLGGSPRLPRVRPLLEATTDIVVATSIVNIWAYDPVSLAAEYAAMVTEALGTAPIVEQLHKMGLVPVGGTPAEFHRKVQADRARWAPVIKESGIKMDA